MVQPLSDYEKQRLANIERNQGVLELLGLAEKKEPACPSSAKSKQQAKSNVPAKPSRVMPRRGQGVQNYNEYFSQQYDALDELEKEEKVRIKYERKANKRQIHSVQHYHSSRPGRSRKKQRPISEVGGLDILGQMAATARILRESSVVEHDKISDKQYAKLFRFRFTPTQLHDATFSKEAVDAFQLYCDERAHIRYPSLTVNHSEKDIIEVAKAISDNSDTSSLDAALVKDYSDAIRCFVCNSDKLAPPMSYKSFNPKVYCPGCNNIFAYTDAGTIRAHSGCNPK